MTRRHSITGNGETWRGAARAAFALACFFPYPAVAIGQNTGLQMGQAAALAAVPFLMTRRPGRHLAAALLLTAPVVVSSFANILLDEAGSPDLAVKNLVALGLSFVVLWPASAVTRRSSFGGLLRIAAAAISVHAAVGLLQVYSFTKDEFPLLFLYTNPSFKSMQEWAPTYALYMKRPCGLFPEPSAMAASLGPWVVLFAGLLVDPSLSPRGSGGRAVRPGGAFALGGLLIVASRSGYIASFAACVSALLAGRAGHLVGAFSVKKYLACCAGLVVCGAAGLYAAAEVSSGYGERVDSSWGLRMASIRLGLTSNTGPRTLAFGVGPGQSTRIIQRDWDGPPIPKGQDDPAVWSLTVRYFMEMGLMGGAALAAVLGMAVRAVARSSAAYLGACCLLAWLVGVAATTSYMSIATIWLFLGLLLDWDRVFPPGRRHRGSFDADWGSSDAD